MRAWGREREALGAVRAHTARKAVQRALLFSPWIGSDDVGGIDPADITRALVELRASGGARGAGLAASTLAAAHLAGRQALDWAVGRGLAGRNPFEGVERPRAAAGPRRFLHPGEASAFAADAASLARASMLAGDERRASFALAACIAVATGMRRGEIFALEWADVDWVRGRISVSRAVKADGSIGGPKSASGVRSIAIGGNLARLLGEARAWQESRAPSRGWARSRYVVANAGGGRASVNTFERWWRGWTAASGWEGLRFHDLRHTHATILIAGGADVKTVQMRLGHSSASITLSVYAHAIPIADAAAATALDAELFG